MTSINLISAQIRPLGSSTKGEVSFGLDNAAKYGMRSMEDIFTSFAEKERRKKEGGSAPFPQKPSSIDSIDWYSVDPDERQEKFFTSFNEKQGKKSLD